MIFWNMVQAGIPQQSRFAASGLFENHVCFCKESQNWESASVCRQCSLHGDRSSLCKYSCHHSGSGRLGYQVSTIMATPRAPTTIAQNRKCWSAKDFQHGFLMTLWMQKVKFRMPSGPKGLIEEFKGAEALPHRLGAWEKCGKKTKSQKESWEI